ncbi:hypothetical protein [Microbacterium sp. R86528]|uniref:hypothetical protein n=1 Tax=Microbacterium sp. R86528 TaxID=3093864 RepID=UPI0037CA644F
METIKELSVKLVPAGAKLVRVQEFPELNAALATYADDGNAYNISIQRPKVPASLQEIAAAGEMTAAKLATGSTQMEVIGADYEQTVIVRASGLTITVSRTGSLPAKAQPSDSARVTAEKLSTRLAAVADTDYLESQVPLEITH